MANFAVIFPAAGKSSRYRDKEKKPFVNLDGRAVWLRSVEQFLSRSEVVQCIIVVSPDDQEMFRRRFGANLVFMNIQIADGGAERFESVANALALLKPEVDFVAVHDAVRPFVERDIIEKVIAEAAASGAAIVGIVPVDTVKQVHRNKVRSTLPRERLVLTQTPQVFRLDLLRQAFEKARQDIFIGTDESSLVERLEQVEVSVVLGTDRNIKITKPTDMELARLYLALESLPLETH